jgi:hypothetical protein
MTSWAFRTGQEAESTQSSPTLRVRHVKHSSVPQQSHDHGPSEHLLTNLIMNHQKKRSLVSSRPSGPSLTTSRCLQPTPPHQHASFGPRSSDSSVNSVPTMAHCTLSGPCTAAELRHHILTASRPLLHFSTVNRFHRHNHTYINPTYSLFSSPSSDALSPPLACHPEPGFERDWPVPDDEVHYC